MESSRATTLWGCVLFTGFGLCTEIVFTGTGAFWGGSFLGYVSLLMIPVYSFVYLIMGPLLRFLEQRGWMGLAIRIPLTVLFIYAIEWSFGAAYQAVGLTPWYYDHGWASEFSNGNITLYYLPAWILFALIVVPAWRIVHSIAPRAAETAPQAISPANEGNAPAQIPSS